MESSALQFWEHSRLSTSTEKNKVSFLTFQRLRTLIRYTLNFIGLRFLTHTFVNLIQVAEETSHLAPHGVPANPIPRALSSSRLNEVGVNQNDSYGTYSTVGGNLGVPGQHNPFANSTQDQNSAYGASY